MLKSKWSFLFIATTILILLISGCTKSDKSVNNKVVTNSDSETQSVQNTPQISEENNEKQNTIQIKPLSHLNKDNSLIRSVEGKNISQLEWTGENKDEVIEFKFGDTNVNLIIGLDHPNGVKALVLFPDDSIGWPLDISGPETNAFNSWGELNEEFRIQAALYDFNQDGIPEIVLSAGDLLLENCFWVFSYTHVENLQKINPIKQELAQIGQAYIELDKSTIYAPYGSQGLFEMYKYIDGQFMQPVQ